MTTKETPLSRQYGQIKAKYPDTILLFRLGDFYETFGDDAVATAKACGITLTKRNNGGANETPLAGFPHHQLDAYLPKLVRGGHRVAICEQLEDPKQAKGIVRRDVVEVVTPGVVMYDKLLDAAAHTYVACITRRGGLAVCDVSTGTFSVANVAPENIPAVIESLQPAELLVNKDETDWWQPLVQRLAEAPSITRREPWLFDAEFTRTELLRHFQTTSLKGFGVEELEHGLVAAGVVMHYVAETQRNSVRQITSLSVLSTDHVMMLDASTRRNLEIHTSAQGTGRVGALVSLMDQTMTPMGGRLLRWWLQAPLVDAEAIRHRHGIVEGFCSQPAILQNMRAVLRGVGDLERLMARVMNNRATARDLASLRNGLVRVPDLREVGQGAASPDVRACASDVVDRPIVRQLLADALVDEPAIQVGNGDIFRNGYHTELDACLDALRNGKQWLAEYLEQERQASGLPTLKIGYTNVFGYYLEVSNANKGRVPDTFERKQTLANAERYTTPRLRELERTLSAAEQNVSVLEAQLLDALRASLAEHCANLQHTAQAIARLDVLGAFAQIALDREYVRPSITDGTELRIVDARHPVIEHLLPPGTRYVANTVTMDAAAGQIHIITGPNMSGKSSYLRQVGLIVFLAHVGAFVPAREAVIPLTDRIFTRVGAQDNIMAGESTFLVEMQEAANIVHNATPRSLILLDEVGRGTATFDGISIAWAIAEHLHNVVGARTLFATHYHELTSLADTLPRVRNYRVDVRETGDTIVFTHRVLPGSSDHSFGIHVARMAGLPASVLRRAASVLQQLEQGTHNPAAATSQVEAMRAEPGQLTMFQVRDDEMRNRVMALDIENMTPMQALHALSELKGSIDG